LFENDLEKLLAEQFSIKISTIRQRYIKDKHLTIGTWFDDKGPSWALQRLCLICLYDRSLDKDLELEVGTRSVDVHLTNMKNGGAGNRKVRGKRINSSDQDKTVSDHEVKKLCIVEKINEDNIDSDLCEELDDLLYEHEPINDELVIKIEKFLRKILDFKIKYFEGLIENIRNYCQSKEGSKNYKSLDGDFGNFNVWINYELCLEYLNLLRGVDKREELYEI